MNLQYINTIFNLYYLKRLKAKLVFNYAKYARFVKYRNFVSRSDLELSVKNFQDKKPLDVDG